VVTARRVALATYDVVIERGLLDDVRTLVHDAAPAHRYAIVTDSNVGPLYAARVSEALDRSRTDVFTIPAGEAHKTRETWGRLTDDLLARGFGRDTTIVALGGGVVGDLAGFVAATFMRGVPYVQMPTSLLAMIDASIGGKTGVDTAAGKNLVGAFHQPAVVLADPALLGSLPPEHLRAGLAEAIKHGVIADAEYFDRVTELARRVCSDASGGRPAPMSDAQGAAMLDLVARSVEIKAGIVQRDEREGGIRKILNFGHTVGHAVELCSGYALLHGEAVAIGMVCESELAERIGLAERGTADRVRTAVSSARLPAARPLEMSVDAIVAATRTDKKARAGHAEYSLPLRVGAMAIAGGRWSMPVGEDVVRAVLGQG
jgi:3-dehydroquinate synthase